MMSTTSTSTHTTPKLSPEFNSGANNTTVNTTNNNNSNSIIPTSSHTQTKSRSYSQDSLQSQSSVPLQSPSGYQSQHDMGVYNQEQGSDVSLNNPQFARSPDSSQQLREYKDLHRLKESKTRPPSSSKFQRHHNSNNLHAYSPKSRRYSNFSDDSNKNIMQSPVDTVDPFLRRYIKNKSPIQISQNSDTDHYSKYIINNLNLFNQNRNLKVVKRRKSRQLNKFVDSRTTSSQSSIKSQASSPVFNYKINKSNELLNNKNANYVKTTDLKLDNFKTSPEKLARGLPTDFIDCNLNDLLTLVSRMLNNLITLNNKSVPESITTSKKDNSKSNPMLTRYHSRSPPNISPISYLSRLIKFNNFSNATLLMTIYYIDLLSYNYQPYFTLNSWTIHRFLLVATMISQKSLEDFFYTNDHYAKVGGVALNELNCLELDFLTRINWSCVPSKQLENGKSSIKYSKEVLDMYYMQLIELMGKNAKNNEFTYVLSDPTGSESQEHITGEDMDKSKFSNYSRRNGDLQDINGHSEGDQETRNGNINTDFSGKSNKDYDVSIDPLYEVDKSKYNNQGFSTDASSSPHLKRRYNNF